MKDNNNYNLKGLSLTFKEQFDSSNLFISSYNYNKISINNIFYNFPICIFGHKIFELNIKNVNILSFNHVKSLITEYKSFNKVDPELILIGINDYKLKVVIKIKNICEKNNIGFDIMKVGQASGTFNFLTIEKRNFITLFI